MIGGDLEFEHVGTMTCGPLLVLCDVEYLPPRFAGAAQGKVGLDAQIEVVAGVWQVLLAYDPSEAPNSAPNPDDDDDDDDDDRPAPRFVLLTHDAELETDVPLDQAEAVALIRVDSGRITALDPDLRDDPDVQHAVLAAPRAQVPCMLREPGADPEASPRGTLIDLDHVGVFELYAAPGRPRTALFLVRST